MEDYVYLDTLEDGLFGGVYDGHGGYKAAECASAHLHCYFFEAVKVGHTPSDSFLLSYRQVHEELTPDMAGTCALTFFIKDEMVYYANAGDGKIIIFDDKGATQLSTDHRVTTPLEKERILAEGGEIKGLYVFTKDYRGLKVTRSLGDYPHKAIGVICDPVTGVYTLKNSDQFLVVGTDGLFDTLTDEAIARIVKDSQGDLAEELVSAALKEGSKDNISAVVIKL